MSLVITRVAGLVTVQDLGRPGRMHEALAPGGALVPELLVAANRAARNADGDAALEVLGRLVVRAEGTTIVAVDAPVVLQDGEELVVASEPRRAAYLALRGGIDAPLVLGGRGTQLSAGLGKPLRGGDRLESAGAFEVDSPPLHSAPLHSAPLHSFADTGGVHVIAGPDLDAFAPDALAQLVAAPYRILSSSDRVGTRLDGRVIARAAGYSETSRPMVRGAIEVPPDGLPIVLGPEHPTTGGYPVIGVIAHADLGRFFAIRLGGSVQLELAGPA